MLEEKAWPAAQRSVGAEARGCLCRNLTVLFMVFQQCSAAPSSCSWYLLLVPGCLTFCREGSCSSGRVSGVTYDSFRGRWSPGFAALRPEPSAASHF